MNNRRPSTKGRQGLARGSLLGPFPTPSRLHPQLRPPKKKPQPLAASEIVLKVIQDVAFWSIRCDEHITAEFKQFLQGIGCSTATIARLATELLTKTVDS